MARKPRSPSPDPAPKLRAAPRSGFAARLASADRVASQAYGIAEAASVQPIELHTWPTPNGWKISIMLEECGLPYVLRPVDIARGEQFSPEFLKLSPNNRIPAIVDPCGPGRLPISVFESGAILQYLGRKTGRYYPADERARVDVDQWVMWQIGGLGPAAGQYDHFRNDAPEPIPYAVTRYAQECRRLYGVMNTRLADRLYLAGEYSIADIACIGWVAQHARMGLDLDVFVHLRRWLAAVMARPAVQRGMKLAAPRTRSAKSGAPTERALES